MPAGENAKKGKKGFQETPKKKPTPPTAKQSLPAVPAKPLSPEEGSTIYGTFQKKAFDLSLRQVVSVLNSDPSFDAEPESYLPENRGKDYIDPVILEPQTEPSDAKIEANMFKFVKLLQTLTPEETKEIVKGTDEGIESNLAFWWEEMHKVRHDGYAGRPIGFKVIPKAPIQDRMGRMKQNMIVWLEQLKTLSDKELKSSLSKTEMYMFWWWGNLKNLEGSENRELFKHTATRLLRGFGEKVEAYEYWDKDYSEGEGNEEE